VFTLGTKADYGIRLIVLLPVTGAMKGRNAVSQGSDITFRRTHVVRRGMVAGTRSGARSCPKSGQLTFTSICFGRTFSLLARCTRSTPSLNSALTLLFSASSGMLKLRSKRP